MLVGHASKLLLRLRSVAERVAIELGDVEARLRVAAALVAGQARRVLALGEQSLEELDGLRGPL